MAYATWQRLGLFRLGRMDDPQYALRIFDLHVARAFPTGLPKDFVALELGPGDSVAGALVARAHGAAKTFLVDVGAFARKDLEIYARIGRQLQREKLSSPDFSKLKSFPELLASCRAEYKTGGLESLRGVPEGSVDFIWSHSVLEHIRKRDFDATMFETYRVLKKGGRASHSIDLMDHLAKSLNNLRFSERTWESEFMAKSGFYTNRLRYSQIGDSIRNAGFSEIEGTCGRWQTTPLARHKFHGEFRDISETDLLVRTCHFALTK